MLHDFPPTDTNNFLYTGNFGHEKSDMTEAMQKMENAFPISRTEEELFGNSLQSEVQKAKRRKLVASVRETGFDTVKDYMKTMCNHELLNKNEEIILAREIQILIKWEETRNDLETKLGR